MAEPSREIPEQRAQVFRPGLDSVDAGKPDVRVSGDPVDLDGKNGSSTCVHFLGGYGCDGGVECHSHCAS